MFTGLITEVGTLTSLKPFAGGQRWIIRAERTAQELHPGHSVSVAGACQTVEQVEGTSFSGTSIQETLEATNFNGWATGERLNLELPLRPTDRIGGHFVTGHVDTVGEVREVQRASPGHTVEIGFSSQFDQWVLEKGSIAVEGVSLTIMRRAAGSFVVSLIPETLSRTTLGDLRSGDMVNLEFDMLVKAAVQSLSAVPRWSAAEW